MSRVVVKASGLLVSVVLVVLMAGGAQAFPVRDSALAQPAGEEWLHVNGDWQGTRFSQLKQLNTFNVKGLKVAWVRALGGTTGLQATPIYHDGLLYIPLDNKVQAIDAKTGRRVWKFEHELPEDWGHWQFNDFATNKHRGVAIYNDKIYFLSNDNVLHALHYKTGEVAFSKKIREHPRTYESSDDAGGYLSTVAPLAIPGKILLPMNASDFGGKPGFVDAVHPDTGELLWSANMIPGPGESGHDSWPGDSAKYGGAGPWITGSWDPDLKMYFTGTANAYPYTPHSERQGRGGGDYENVGAASIVAVNTDSGKVAWRYTVVPGDPFDYDTAPTPLILMIDGKKTIVQPNKTGFITYLDAESGRFLKAVPFSDRITWASGFTEEGKPIWTQQIPKEGGDPVEVWPSLLGGVNMYPTAFNPGTGMLYLAAREMGMLWSFEKVQVQSNVQLIGATFELPPGGYELDKAVNARTGKEVWRHQKSKDGFSGGMLTTAGNLTVYGDAGGIVTVVHAMTGEILWTFHAGVTFKAAPITYMVDGKQYITIAGGGLPTFGSAPDDHALEHGSIMLTFVK